jgi:hypothetical protein
MLAAYVVPQHRIVHTFFPKVRPHAPDTLQTPSRSQFSFWGRVKYSIWELSKFFKQRNVKYAMKAGIAIALLASPAFFDATRPFFVEYQGDWALVSVRCSDFFLLALADKAPDLCRDIPYHRSHQHA